jgi:ribokinase
VIVVLGRPGLGIVVGDEPAEGPVVPRLHGLAAQICIAARNAGADVEMVGAVGDDTEGDQVMVALGRAGIGHAAVLRDPSARTPTGSVAEPRDAAGLSPEAGLGLGNPAPSGQLPRLDPGDVSLGLSYVSECRVLVIAEPLSGDANAVAAEAAAYHGAAIVAVADEGAALQPGLPDDATVLAATPGEQAAFADLVGRYVAALDNGAAPAEAFRQARDAAGWETVGR